MTDDWKNSRHDPYAYDAPPRPWRSGWRPKVRPQILRLIARDGLNCHWCGRTCDLSLGPNADLYPTRDHLIRLCEGGKSRMENLVLACRKCNNCRHNPRFNPDTHDRMT